MCGNQHTNIGTHIFVRELVLLCYALAVVGRAAVGPGLILSIDVVCDRTCAPAPVLAGVGDVADAALGANRWLDRTRTFPGRLLDAMAARHDVVLLNVLGASPRGACAPRRGGSLLPLAVSKPTLLAAPGLDSIGRRAAHDVVPLRQR